MTTTQAGSVDRAGSHDPGPRPLSVAHSTSDLAVVTNSHSSRLRAFRPDVEGLRAIAVLAVVGYHAGVPGLSGGFVGVDVFFVISGFLISRHLLAELTASSRIDVVRFWARRIRRLLPAAVLVTVSTVLAGWVLLDPLQAHRLSVDALWTAGYAANWHLALDGTNYLTATRGPSPLQHYWSLAVEEQYYLLWPLGLLAVGLATRRVGRHRQLQVVAVLLALLTAASFAASIWQTRSAQPWAYFGLQSRAWELGAGGLLALADPRLSRLRLPVAGALGWLGLAAVLGAASAFDTSTTFPGVAAALPVVGAALVVAGGCAAPAAGAELVLGRGPLQLLGALSYGWYLWHWPLLRLSPALVGHPLDLRHRVLICLLALVLAAGTFALVEHPVRRVRWPELRPLRFVAVGAGLTAATAALALVALVAGPVPVGSGATAQAADLGRGGSAGPLANERGLTSMVGAAVRQGLDIRAVPANLTPSLADAATTLPQPQRVGGCHASFAAVTPRTDCVYGDRVAARTIVLLGDSHALQWFPALQRIAATSGYRLVSMTKSSCTPFAITTYNEALQRPYGECDTWRARAMTDISRLHPSLVVVSSLTGLRDHGLAGGGLAFDRAWAAGARSTIGRLEEPGTRVDVIEDTTNPGRSVPECLAGHLGQAESCDYYRTGGLYPAGRRVLQAAAVRAAGATDIDPTSWLCAASRCPVVVGNLLVFRDEQHLSTAYASWLAPALQLRLGL